MLAVLLITGSFLFDRRHIAMFLLAATVVTLFAGVAFPAAGYGTSSISFSSSELNVTPGGSASVNYTVSLASGNTWGTSVSVADQAVLASQGINVTLSKTFANPTFYGLITLTTSASTSNGIYSVVLDATGDDPSVSNATLTVIVGHVQNATATPTTSVAAPPAKHNANSIGTNLILMVLGIGVVLVAMALSMIKKKAPSSRLILLGVALIAIGVIVWLYGDYSGGVFTYIWSGVALIVFGAAVWLVGDHMGHLI